MRTPEEQAALTVANTAWEARVKAAYAKLTLPTDEELTELRVLVMSGGPNLFDEYPRLGQTPWNVLREVSDNSFALRALVGRRSRVPK